MKNDSIFFDTIYQKSAFLRKKQLRLQWHDTILAGHPARQPSFTRKHLMEKERFDITGMTCSACSSRVDKAVVALDGVHEVSVNLLKNSMNVSFDPAITSEKAIIAAVEKAGYGARAYHGKPDIPLRRPDGCRYGRPGKKGDGHPAGGFPSCSPYRFSISAWAIWRDFPCRLFSRVPKMHWFSPLRNFC